MYLSKRCTIRNLTSRLTLQEWMKRLAFSSTIFAPSFHSRLSHCVYWSLPHSAGGFRTLWSVRALASTDIQFRVFIHIIFIAICYQCKYIDCITTCHLKKPSNTQYLRIDWIIHLWIAFMMPSMIRPKSFFFLELVFTTSSKNTFILPDIYMREREGGCICQVFVLYTWLFLRKWTELKLQLSYLDPEYKHVGPIPPYFLQQH